MPHQISVLSADSEHIEVLRRGPRAWNAWRTRNPSMLPILTCIALSASERQMGPVNGGPINLASARLRRASFRFATLSGANLETADLSNADLTDTRLDGANLTNADLSQAVLDRTDFAGAKLTGANLCGTNLQKTRNLTQGQLANTIGDVYTILPSHLHSPLSWAGSQAGLARQVANSWESRDLAQITIRGARAGTRVSWLVGGPLSTA